MKSEAEMVNQREVGSIVGRGHPNMLSSGSRRPVVAPDPRLPIAPGHFPGPIGLHSDDQGSRKSAYRVRPPSTNRV